MEKARLERSSKRDVIAFFGSRSAGVVSGWITIEISSEGGRIPRTSNGSNLVISLSRPGHDRRDAFHPGFKGVTIFPRVACVFSDVEKRMLC